MTTEAKPPLDDATLLARFEDGSLPFDQWTHRTHVRVAYLYLDRHDLDDAITRIGQGIRAYNAKNAVPEGPLMGYHETTTQALMRVIHAVKTVSAETHPVASSEEFCDRHPQLMSKHVLRLFYSPTHRLRPEAKTRFVPPDMAPLPVAEGGHARRDRAAPTAAHDLLVRFVAERDVICPRCGYNLRGVQGAACPECGDELELRIGLVEPRLAAYVTMIVVTSVGLGGSGLFSMLALFAAPSGWWVSLSAILLLVQLGLTGAVLAALLSRRRRVRRMALRRQWWLAVALMVVVGGLWTAITLTFRA